MKRTKIKTGVNKDLVERAVQEYLREGRKPLSLILPPLLARRGGLRGEVDSTYESQG